MALIKSCLASGGAAAFLGLEAGEYWNLDAASKDNITNTVTLSKPTHSSTTVFNFAKQYTSATFSTGSGISGYLISGDTASAISGLTQSLTDVDYLILVTTSEMQSASVTITLS